MNEQNNNPIEGMDNNVSTDAFAQDPVLAQYQTDGEQQKWLTELEASRKERKETDSNAVKAIKRYRDDRKESFKDARFYNIFFANTDIKASALYAQTPQPDIKTRFNDANDDVARVAANILERNIRYELDCGDFDQTIKQIIFDRLVPGMGIGWVRLDHETEMQPQPPLQQPPMPHPTIPGAMVQPDPIPQPDQEVTTYQEACVDYVAWDDFYWAPSKVWTLCPWVARRIPMNKAAINARFGNTCPENILKEITYSDKPKDDQQGKLAPQNLTEPTADVYEIWDKERELIIWINETCEVPLDVQSDTNKFEGFFPTPMPPLGRFASNSTQPLSDYKLVQGKYEELDDLNMRCAQLSKAMGVRFVYDASSPEIKDLFTTTKENTGIGVTKWDQFSSTGGLSGKMQFAPLKDISDAFAGASAQLDRIKEQIYEIEGIGDILRGAATPYETATATNVKSAQSFGRFAVMQADVATYIQKLLRLKAHVMARFYEPQFILERAGAPHPEDQQFVMPALQMLKDQAVSDMRINVSVDSIQLPNWNNEKAERSEAVQAVTSFLAQAMPAIQQMPELAPFSMELLKFTIAGFKGSKGMEGILDQGIQAIQQSIAQKQQQPPTPTPEQTKAQAAQAQSQATLQAVQMQEQTKLNVAQINAQVSMAKVQQAAQDSAADNQARQEEARLRAASIAMDAHHDAVTHAHSAAVDIVQLSKPQGGK